MKARNINGTSDNDCKCGSWINHWKKHHPGLNWVLFCSEKNCLADPEVGAHVQKADENDMSWYIIPLCKKHNALRGQEIDVVWYATFVSANKSETCEK